MNHIKRGISIGVALLVIVASTVFAEEGETKGAKQEMLAEMWVMIPKTGKMKELEKAIVEHIKFRRDKQEPREWHVYSPVLGHKLDRIAVRANGFTWKDMDSYRDWSMKEGIDQHWEKTGGDLVDHYHHYISVEDHENSNWGPDVKYRYVGVTSYIPKIGHRMAIEKDKKAMVEAAKSQNWPYHWAFAQEIGGRGEISLAVPYQNWASMAPPETKFMKTLSNHMGAEEAKKLMESWGSHFEEISYNIWALRSDMMK
ncbi:hypothetical protein [Alteromonas sp. ASW11-130]|uniref:hypothetical protein n=1 Tax=Alteromonas sp. ASW11-130 TaxID=3015775 RepID=UPI002241E38E|nr:hypothetical protein [Alteromonas sp. ASW11-130]MCW8091201.1 hypothetical protein [Alteromonas sp. ASW11-130]